MHRKTLLMATDAEAIRAVMSWVCGFVVLGMVGVAIPLLLAFLPDAIHLWRRRGEVRVAAAFAVVIVGVAVLTLVAARFAGTPGTPGTTLWLTLALLLGTACGGAAFCFTVARALGRRSARRRALEVATAAPTDQAGSLHGIRKPAAVQRLTARGAELLACGWMQHLGAIEAVVTPERRDGGVDVRSRDFVAQVKHLREEQTGVAVVRQLYGVASAERRRALFFSTSGYTRDALAFARENGVALFVVRYREGRLVPHGALAQHYFAQGLGSRPRAERPAVAVAG